MVHGMAETFPCPHCGQPVRAGSGFCRECGSDAGIGWSEEEPADGIDLPETMSQEEYADYLAREFPGAPGARRKSSGIIWAAVGVAISVAFLMWLTGS